MTLLGLALFLGTISIYSELRAKKLEKNIDKKYKYNCYNIEKSESETQKKELPIKEHNK